MPMTNPAESDLSTRLKRLPRQLLLALVNGTAILVIAASILGIIATSKITHLAETVASTMTDAVLSRVGENPRQLVQSVRQVSDDVHKLTALLKDARAARQDELDPEIAKLNERLVALNANLEQLRAARADLVDSLIASAGAAIGAAVRARLPSRRTEPDPSVVPEDGAASDPSAAPESQSSR